MINWVLIYTSPTVHIIEMVKANLTLHHIDSTTINKMDSSYPHVGDIELYVDRDKVMEAKQIISNLGLE